MQYNTSSFYNQCQHTSPSSKIRNSLFKKFSHFTEYVWNMFTEFINTFLTWSENTTESLFSVGIFRFLNFFLLLSVPTCGTLMTFMTTGGQAGGHISQRYFVCYFCTCIKTSKSKQLAGNLYKSPFKKISFFLKKPFWSGSCSFLVYFHCYYL